MNDNNNNDKNNNNNNNNNNNDNNNNNNNNLLSVTCFCKSNLTSPFIVCAKRKLSDSVHEWLFS